MNNNLKKKEKDTNRPLITFLLVVLIFGMFGISYFIYEMAYVNQEENNNQDEVKYNFDIYKNSDGRICGNENNWCNELAFSIETETEDASYITSDNEYEKTLFILYKDNGLKLYNIKTKEITKINLEDNYKSYTIYLNNKKDKVAGIIYRFDDNTSGYFNVLKNIKLYEGEYTHLSFLDEKYLSGFGNKNSLLSTNLEKEELTSTEVYYHLRSYNGKYFFFEYDNSPFEGVVGGNIVKVYNNNKQVIFDGKVDYYKTSFMDGILYLTDENVIKKYDTSGNLISTSDKLSDVKGMINNHAVYVEDNNLSLYNVDTKDKIVITNWKSNYNYDSYTSGYYDRETLDLMEEPEKEEGLYLVITFDKQDSNGNYGIEYCYNPKTKEIKTYDIKEIIGG